MELINNPEYLEAVSFDTYSYASTECETVVEEQTNTDINELSVPLDENSSNFKVDENYINQKRLAYLDKKITPIFLALIKTEDFEFGKKNESVLLIEEQLKINSVATQNWFNKLYIKNFSNNEKTLIGLLRVVESLDQQALHPTAETMAIAALSHKNDEIKELGIRIFENWGSINSYELLKNLKVGPQWLQDYINQVIKDIEAELWLS